MGCDSRCSGSTLTHPLLLHTHAHACTYTNTHGGGAASARVGRTRLGGGGVPVCRRRLQP